MELEHAGLVVRSLRPADFGGKGPQFEIRTPKGRVSGPFGPDVLRAMVRDELLTPHCSLRKSGDLETHSWHPAWKVKGLFPGHVVDSIRRSHTVTRTDDGDTAKLKALKQQLDDGLIDERDYRFKKGEILGTPYEVEGSEPVHRTGVNDAAQDPLGYLYVTCDGCGITGEVSCGGCGRPDRFHFDGYAARCDCGGGFTMVPCWECGTMNTARSMRWSATKWIEGEGDKSEANAPGSTLSREVGLEGLAAIFVLSPLIILPIVASANDVGGLNGFLGAVLLVMVPFVFARHALPDRFRWSGAAAIQLALYAVLVPTCMGSS